MQITPLQVAFYKGMGGKFGAVQFNLQKPHYYCTTCKTKVYDQALPPMKCPSRDCAVDEKLKSREGAIFVEICSANGKNSYDWKNKIIVSLSATDMSQVLYFVEHAQAGEALTIQHDPGAGGTTQGKVMKYLNLSTPNGMRDVKKADGSLVKGGMFVQISEVQSTDKDKKEHRVPLNAQEVKQLGVLLRAAIAVAYSWT